MGKERVHYEAPARSAAQARDEADFSTGSTSTTERIRCSRLGSRISGSSPSIPLTTATGVSRAPLPTWCSRVPKTAAQRFYSMSAQIRQERKAYYDILEATQKGDLEITPWLEWFLDCLDRAFDGAETTLAAVLKKARFWDAYAGTSLNDRQRKIINRLLNGFEGKLTSSKWAKLAKCSQDTALRDIDDLVRKGILVKDAAGGRSTSYSLAEGWL